MKHLFFIILAGVLYACNNEPVLIVTPAPVATAATFITNEHFTANWHDVEGADGYDLEIATDVDFSAIILTEEDVVTGKIIFGMDSKTEYFYRVRTKINGQTPSVNSNVISLYTLPDPPIATAATNVTSDGFTANWNEVPGISNYLLFLSLDGFSSNPPVYVPGYEGKDVTGTSSTVSGLSSNTIYYYAIKAKGDESISFYSNAIIAVTKN